MTLMSLFAKFAARNAKRLILIFLLVLLICLATGGIAILDEGGHFEPVRINVGDYQVAAWAEGHFEENHVPLVCHFYFVRDPFRLHLSFDDKARQVNTVEITKLEFVGPSGETTTLKSPGSCGFEESFESISIVDGKVKKRTSWSASVSVRFERPIGKDIKLNINGRFHTQQGNIPFVEQVVLKGRSGNFRFLPYWLVWYAEQLKT